MKRQLKKVVFLPLNEEVLFDKSYLEPPSFLKCFSQHRSSFFKFLYKHLKFFFKRIFSKKISDFNSYSQSIWASLRYIQNSGFEIILYQNNDEIETDEKEKLIQLMITKKLINRIIKINHVNDFNKAIINYNINPHNSWLISNDYNLVEQIIKIYHPRNYINTIEESKIPLGFKIILWDEKKTGKKNNNIHINAVENLYKAICKDFKYNPLIYSSRDFKFMHGKIIYIEEQWNENVNQFIKENLQWIEQETKLKGNEFIYLPLFKENNVETNIIRDFFHYSNPYLIGKLSYEFIEYFKNFSSPMFSVFLLDILNLPAFKTPALLRNRYNLSALKQEYSYFTIDKSKDIRKQFQFYFNTLQSIYSSKIFFQLKKKSQDETIDDSFNLEDSKLAHDVLEKIEYFKNQGLNNILTEIAIRLFEGSGQNILKKIYQLKTPVLKESLSSNDISKLIIEWTNKFNYQVILADYNNMIVDMPRLPKALYYFFIQHSEGIMLTALSNYYKELLAIYSRISNFSDKDEIENNVKRLIDPLDNSINVNCSRIKSAFVKLINDEIAKNYYISGYRGEPKKIILPKEKILIINIH
jgi:hypothetical protein